VPNSAQETDEISSDRVPSRLKAVHCQGAEEKAVPITLDNDAEDFEIGIMPEAWICHEDEGWCRLFTKTFKIMGKK